MLNCFIFIVILRWIQTQQMWFRGNGNTHLFVFSNNCSFTKVFVQISRKATPWKMINMILSKDNITNYCHTTQYRSVWQTTAAHNFQTGACSFNSSGKCVSANIEYEWTDTQQMGAIVFGMTLKLYGSWIISCGCLILLISNIIILIVTDFFGRLKKG